MKDLTLFAFSEIRATLNIKSSELSRLSMRKELIKESQSDLESDTATVDSSLIERLYREANVLIPNLQKTFEESLKFHNQMINEKVKYITKELPELEIQIKGIEHEIQLLLNSEKTSVNKLKKSGAIEELQVIISELNEKYEQKGKFEEQLSNIDKSNNSLTRITDELEEISERIQSKDAIIQEKITEFNKYFSSLTNALYGENFALSADFVNGSYQLQISSMHGRLGTGKKKGEIIAFDLAYVQFADSNGITCLKFILHDQLEVVHGNQITQLLKMIQQSNCQFIVPILKDKLPTELRAPSFEVVSLSQNDKLFKV